MVSKALCLEGAIMFRPKTAKIALAVLVVLSIGVLIGRLL
jgi:hypothetical protein